MNLKKKKNFLALCLTFALICSLLSIQTSAASYTLDWNLVDSGKHLDYDGNSKYMSYADTAAFTWNSHKSGVIRKDSIWVIQDLYISDVYRVDGSTGVTYSNGKIELNTYYLDKCTYSQILNTVTHEIGHALGLAHSPSKLSVMYYAQTSTTTLSKDDKDSYNTAYTFYNLF